MNDLETHVLRLIGEDTSSPDVFTNTDAGMAQIRNSLNDAIQELCMVSGSYRRTYHLGLLQNRQFYRLAPQNDYLGWIVGAWDRSQKRRLERTDLMSISRKDPWWMKTTGPPLQYMQLGVNHIGIYMSPSTNGIVLELDCVMIPLAYADDAQPVKLRHNFQQAAIYLAVSEFYASRGDAKRAQEYLNRYLETAGLMQLHPLQPERQWRFGGNDTKAIEVPA
jgi:hypothetical protein